MSSRQKVKVGPKQPGKRKPKKPSTSAPGVVKSKEKKSLQQPPGQWIWEAPRQQLMASINSVLDRPGVRRFLDSAPTTTENWTVETAKKYQASRYGQTTRRHEGTNEPKSYSEVKYVPQNFGVAAKNFFDLKMGKAAYHDDFPEGGLRLTGELPDNTDDYLGMCATGTVTSTGLFQPTIALSTASGALVPVTPTAFYGGTQGCVHSMFGVSTNVIAQIAAKCRYFRFRKLCLLWEGESATTATQSAQFAYDRSFIDLASNVSQASSQIAGATAVVDRFPIWTPRRLVTLINDMHSTPSDKLWNTTGPNIGLASNLSNADYELYFQGGISGITDVTQTASTQKFARYRWCFVLDLYGLTPQNADGVVAYGYIPGDLSPRENAAYRTAYNTIAARRRKELEDEFEELKKELESELDDARAQMTSDTKRDEVNLTSLSVGTVSDVRLTSDTALQHKKPADIELKDLRKPELARESLVTVNDKLSQLQSSISRVRLELRSEVDEKAIQVLESRLQGFLREEAFLKALQQTLSS